MAHSRKVEIFQHVPFEGPAYLNDILEASGYEVSVRHLYENPSDIGVAAGSLLITMGGPMSVHDTAQYPWMNWEIDIIKRQIAHRMPVLGICLGAQLIAAAMGAEVYRNQQTEIGWFPVVRTAQYNPIPFQNLPSELEVLHWHGDTFDLPKGAALWYSSNGCKNHRTTHHSVNKIDRLLYR